MTIISRTAAIGLLFGASATRLASLLPVASAQDDVIVGKVVEPDETTEPIEEHVNVGSSTILVTVSSDSGLTNAENFAKGKGAAIRNAKKFNRPQPARGPPGGKSQGGGKGVGGGNNPGKGKGRALEDEVTNIGYVVIDSDVDLTDDDLAECEAQDGVTACERDTEVTVAEVRGLRGEHFGRIVDALKSEESNLPHRRNLVENTALFGIDMVNVSHLWDLTPAAHVKICVIDTGYDLGHEDLPKNPEHGVTGWDTNSSSYGYWHIDGHSHGTHCAGTIGAIGNNDVGVIGVNPDPTRFSFMIGKGLSDSGSGYNTVVLEAVNQCVAGGAKVISMSLGGGGFSTAADAVYREATDAGVLVVAAAGNSGSDGMHYPASYENVMAVASVTEGSGATYGTLSSFSTRNTQVEIAGPGSGVLSTVPGAYGTKSGTSMACPHVAGVAALLFSHFPSCTNNQIRNAMIRSTREPPTGDSRNSPGWDKYYGWGIVNAGKAYELLSTMGCEGAGGAVADGVSVTLSQQALGGQDQILNGCTMDDHCFDANLCRGSMKCNTATNQCYVEVGSEPNCDDGIKCTIDTCDPSIPIVNGPTDMCVHTPMTCEDGNKCNGVQVCQESTGTCVVETPAPNCDDGNACTIDSCIPSTGVCTNTPRTCNDANVCTLNDTCNPLTGCVFQAPEPDCCGNAECEASETAASCPQDCGTSLGTSLSTSVAYYGYLGNMFNIATKSKNIAIAGFGLHCVVPSGTVHIWTRSGDYYAGGVWYQSGMWTKVLEKEITCNGLGNATYAHFENAVTVEKDSIQAFNIIVIAPDGANPTIRAVYGTNRYQVYTENLFLAIQAGSGNRATNGFGSISTPIALSGSVEYAVLNDPSPTDGTTAPTQSPTISLAPTTARPSKSPTPVPIPYPTGSPVTPEPTGSPTKEPTNYPTVSPTKKPTTSPTESPTEIPSTSVAPSPFIPDVVELRTPAPGPSNILRAAYLEVQGADVWTTITDLMITTYGTNWIEVYFKYGDAAPYEATPCAWKKVAETSPSWNGGYWNAVYPPWVNGFEKIILSPGKKASFYIVNMGSSYGILGKSYSNANKYFAPWASLDATSPVGAMTMSIGRIGYNDQPFNPYPTYYSGYGIWGGFKLETMRPGSTESPTPSPTELYTPGSLTLSHTGSDEFFNGMQFKLFNKNSNDVIVTKFSIAWESSGSQSVEVWFRDGEYDIMEGTCENWNNWCSNWSKVASGTVTAAGPGVHVSTPLFTAIAKAGAYSSFAVVSGSGALKLKGAGSDVEDGVLTVKTASRIDDYYSNNVQTSAALNPTPYYFDGIIDYDIARSKCAIQSKASWVVMNPMGASSLGDGGEGDGSTGPIAEETVDPPPEGSGGGGEGGGLGGEGPIDEERMG